MPVIDTNILIAASAGDDDALAAIAAIRDEPLLVPAIVAAEYLAGQADPRTALQALSEGYTIVQTTPEWISLAAKTRAAMRGRQGRGADFWIACWARLHDTYVVTKNVKDFEALGVRARGW